ncbi:MAG: hypothetical protein GX569_03615 [Candidatus Riflebacteria bacterium]|nr:hypothetical protein [Candidatus Riflebacteria bacterium]
MKKLTIALMVIAVLLFACGIYNYYRYHSSIDAFSEQTLAEARARMQDSAENIDRQISDLQKQAAGLAEEFARDFELKASSTTRFQEILASSPVLLGAGLLKRSELASADSRRRSPGYVAKGEKASLNLADLLQLCVYSAGVTSDGDEDEVVVFDLSRQQLQNYLYSLHVCKQGYAFIIASNGEFICHPSESLMRAGKTIYDHANEEKVASLADLGKAAASGQSGKFDLLADVSGNPMWGLLLPMKTTGWSLVKIILKEPVLQPTVEQQKQRYAAVTLIVVSISMLLLLAGLALSKDTNTRWWAASVLLSAGLCVGIAVLWQLNLSNVRYSHRGEVPVADEGVLEQYLDNLSYRMILDGHDVPKRIKTGVFLQSVDFQSAVSLKITGYVWQKFRTDLPMEVEEGVIFPDAQEVEMEKAYERTIGNMRTVGWHFSLLLRESFDYQTYPFDLESVWLRMWPVEFDKNIVLVPDFDSYVLMTPEFLPGIEASLLLPGWKLLQSNFSYLAASYNTNFGIARYAGIEDFPELHFNLIIRRNFMDPFISSILPLIVVLILLFIMQMTCSREENLKDLFGFSAGAILAGVAALFFVVIFAHIDLRKGLEVAKIMYMDFYYFVIYLLFMLVSVNSVLFCWPREFSLIHYRDNLIPKLLYWPFVLSVLFVTTAFYFSP